MRFTRFAFALLTFAAVLSAADPLAGTWKLNPAKSVFTKGNAPKEQTLIIMDHGTDLHIVVKGTTADGVAINSSFTIPAKGGTGKIIESSYEGVVGKVINANERETTYSKGGKAVYHTHTTLLPGGKTLKVAAKGTNVAGKEIDGVVFYDKQ
jgi:hypothetical protein